MILDIVDMQPSSKIKGGTSSSPRRSRRPPSKFDDFIPVEYKKKSKAKDNTKHQPKLPATQQQKRSQSTLKHPNPRTAYPRQLPVRNQSSTVASKGNDTTPSPKTLAKKPTPINPKLSSPVRDGCSYLSAAKRTSPNNNTNSTTATTKKDTCGSTCEDNSDSDESSDDEACDVIILAGDVIEYYTPIGVAGDPFAKRNTVVIGVRPQEDVQLALLNGEVIPETNSNVQHHGRST